MRRPLAIAVRVLLPWTALSLLWGCTAALMLPLRSERMALTAEQAKSVRARHAPPASFKMVHQVAAQFRGQTFLLTGYLLARSDGDFRVTGLAPVGPRLFDVARVRGRWESALYLDAARGKLDPVHIGRAVQRIYFTGAEGPMRADRGHWRADVAVEGDAEVDSLQEWRDPETLDIVHKRFLKSGRPVLDIDYEAPDRVQGHRFARRVRLNDARGFTLTLQVAEYVPGFPVGDEQLAIQRQPQTAP